MNIRGSIPALITPMSGEDIDYKSFENLLTFHQKNNSDGLVIGGTTGESPTLCSDELATLISTAKQTKLPIIAGAGGNNTKKVITLAKKLEKAGADCLLSVVPYYNKPPQEGLYEHFSALAKATDLPIILYNVPGRVVASLESETISKLAENHKNIIGIKDCTGNFDFLKKIKQTTPNDFKIFLGEDDLAITARETEKLVAGSINVIGNIFPASWSKIWSSDVESARTIFENLKALIPLLFSPANPIPVKYILYKRGLIKNDGIRLPLVWLPPKYKTNLEEVLSKIAYEA